MSLGYLLASLPMLFPDRNPAITAEAFASACTAAVSATDAAAAIALATGETDSCTHPAVRAWCDLDAAIACAIGRCRLARKAGGGGAYTPPETAACPVWLTRMVDAAFDGATDPLAREEALMRVRWAAAEELGGFDPMAKGQLFAYAVKLHLALRRAARDAARGSERLEAALPQNQLTI